MIRVLDGEMWMGDGGEGDQINKMKSRKRGLKYGQQEEIDRRQRHGAAAAAAAATSGKSATKTKS